MGDVLVNRFVRMREASPADTENVVGANKPGPSGIRLLPPTWADELRDAVGTRAFLSSVPTEQLQRSFGWDTLNRLLLEGRLVPPRLRLSRDEKEIPPDSYVSPVKDRRGIAIDRVDMTALLGWLRGGATLVLDAVDELHEPLRWFADEIEDVLDTPIQANLYASWGTSTSFGLHADAHDVVVTQFDGRKRWRTQEQCGAPQIGLASVTTDVIVLEAGDILYLPRGWWHLVEGIGRPSLHVTFGLTQFTEPEARARRGQDRRPRRPGFPWIGSPGEAVNYPDHHEIRWAHRRSVVQRTDGLFAIVAAGYHYELRPPADRLVIDVQTGGPLCVGEWRWRAEFDGWREPNAVLEDLVASGLVTILEPTES